MTSLSRSGLPLQDLQDKAFAYFRHETNPLNGLVADKTAPGWPASIAATGLALSCYPVAVERGLMSRDTAIARTLATLRFFRDSPQGSEPDATGYRGFYYHFLDMQSGCRAWQCELSTVDSGFLFAGMLTAAAYFNDDTPEQSEIRDLADLLYRRADWSWAQAADGTIGHGWHPESGFIPHRWQGYDEGLLLYVLALGSPTHPLPAALMRRGPPPTNGSAATTSTTCMPGRCSPISCRMCGLIFAASRTRSCAARASTISRTAGAPR